MDLTNGRSLLEVVASCQTKRRRHLHLFKVNHRKQLQKKKHQHWKKSQKKSSRIFFNVLPRIALKSYQSEFVLINCVIRYRIRRSPGSCCWEFLLVLNHFNDIDLCSVLRRIYCCGSFISYNLRLISLYFENEWNKIRLL